MSDSQSPSTEVLVYDPEATLVVRYDPYNKSGQLNDMTVNLSANRISNLLVGIAAQQHQRLLAASANEYTKQKVKTLLVRWVGDDTLSIEDAKELAEILDIDLDVTYTVEASVRYTFTVEVPIGFDKSDIESSLVFSASSDEFYLDGDLDGDIHQIKITQD